MENLNYEEMYKRMTQNCRQVLLTMVIEDSKFMYKNNKGDHFHRRIQSYRLDGLRYVSSSLKEVLCYKGLHTCRLSWVKILCPYFKKFIPELTVINMWSVIRLKHMDFRINEINGMKKNILRNFITERTTVKSGRKLEICVYDDKRGDRLFPLSEKKYYEFYKTKIEDEKTRKKKRWSRDFKNYIEIHNNGWTHYFGITIDTDTGRIYFTI